ncbi:MAG: translation initiation factor IF-2, partial [Treponema sp.]|nr:translation initiation factor IF-2 [Treponema sp.]
MAEHPNKLPAENPAEHPNKIPADEADKTKKTKTLLIKHSHNEQESSAGKNQGDQGERRKVKVLVKKPSAPVNKKPSPKVVVSSAPSGKPSHPKRPENQERKQGQDNAADASRISAFPIAQRPAAAAGRVGGKLVGNQNQPQRPARPQQPRGNRPNNEGAHPPHKGGFNQRPQGTRPPFTPKPGQKPGFTGGFNRPQNRSMNTAPATPIPEGKGPAKRKFITKKPVYNRKEKELEMEEKLLQTKKKITHVANPVPKSIDIMEVISVSELARKMNLKASDLISKLMSMGQMVTINQQIDADTATLLAAEFGADVKIVSLYDETVIETASDEDAVLLPRPPVITVMGHVDHGKTKLLDAIRKADVVSGEFGGITQHIGAYMVETPHGSLTFLDTPGHEAFTRMRARGAQITDIVVLVVAADDGVMPQTIEAINHAKDAKVPIIVAVNKIDKPEANPDRVKSQLSDLGLMPEDWGGQTMFVELSALQKTGIDKLIDAILLEAELLDLRANFQRNAEGKILESKVDHGRGIVATVMVERGTLAIGDAFVAGIWPGKVRAIFNDKGDKINKATPSMPVEVLGFEGIPNAGDPLQVVGDEKVAREFSSKRQELKRFEDAKIMRKVTMDNLHDMISDGTI